MPDINLSLTIFSAAIMIAILFKIIFEKREIVIYHFLEDVVYRDDRCEFIVHESYELSKRFDERVLLKKQTGFSNAKEFNGLHQDGIVTVMGKMVIKGQYIGRTREGNLFVLDKNAFKSIYANRPTLIKSRRAS